MFNAFAPKKEMQLYNRGVLATMLANDMQPRSLRCRLEELLENGGSTYLYLKQTGVCEVARPWTGELWALAVCRGSGAQPRREPFLQRHAGSLLLAVQGYLALIKTGRCLTV